MKKILGASHFVFALFFLWLGLHLKDPHLLMYRNYETPLLIATAIIGVILAIYSCRSNRFRSMILSMIWVTLFFVVIYGEFSFRTQKYEIQHSRGDSAQQLQVVGKHLIIGYDNVNNVTHLVHQGFIAGVYLSQRNIRTKSVQQLREEISGLQKLRRDAGLPPLLVATDQEGGAVSHLSPPLHMFPALSTIADPTLAPKQLQQSAMLYGAEQAKDLSWIGVNVNFSPVVDLKPAKENDWLDLYTRIEERAISRDPTIVSHVAIGYARGLYSQGVMPTLKHFPGLGSVAKDTHNFSATLSLPIDILINRDWHPFQAVIRSEPAFLMVGHVVVEKLDPHYPASISRKVVDGLLRKRWQYQGVVISDDMTMAAVYDLGLCRAAVNSLNAGVDLLLLAYDWEKVYPTLACLQRSYASGSLTDLESSELRLSKTPWIISQNHPSTRGAK